MSHSCLCTVCKGKSQHVDAGSCGLDVWLWLSSPTSQTKQVVSFLCRHDPHQRIQPLATPCHLTCYLCHCPLRLRLQKPISWPNTFLFLLYTCIFSNFLRFISGLHVGSCLYCGTSGIWSLTVFSYERELFCFPELVLEYSWAFFVREYSAHQNASFMPLFCVPCVRGTHYCIVCVCAAWYGTFRTHGLQYRSYHWLVYHYHIMCVYYSSTRGIW